MIEALSRSTYKRDSTFCKAMDRLLVEFIICDCEPLSIVESETLGKCFNFLDKRYNMPSRKYLQHNLIIPMYNNTKYIIMTRIKSAPSVALTCDFWKSQANVIYI